MPIDSRVSDNRSTEAAPIRTVTWLRSWRAWFLSVVLLALGLIGWIWIDSIRSAADAFRKEESVHGEISVSIGHFDVLANEKSQLIVGLDPSVRLRQSAFVAIPLTIFNGDTKREQEFSLTIPATICPSQPPGLSDQFTGDDSDRSAFVDPQCRLVDGRHLFEVQGVLQPKAMVRTYFLMPLPSPLDSSPSTTDGNSPLLSRADLEALLLVNRTSTNRYPLRIELWAWSGRDHFRAAVTSEFDRLALQAIRQNWLAIAMGRQLTLRLSSAEAFLLDTPDKPIADQIPECRLNSIGDRSTRVGPQGWVCALIWTLLILLAMFSMSRLWRFLTRGVSRADRGTTVGMS